MKYFIFIFLLSISFSKAQEIELKEYPQDTVIILKNCVGKTIFDITFKRLDNSIDSLLRNRKSIEISLNIDNLEIPLNKEKTRFKGIATGYYRIDFNDSTNSLPYYKNFLTSFVNTQDDNVILLPNRLYELFIDIDNFKENEIDNWLMRVVFKIE